MESVIVIFLTSIIFLLAVAGVVAVLANKGLSKPWRIWLSSGFASCGIFIVFA